MDDLSKVSIMIKTFLRDLHLEEAVAGIQAAMPAARMVILDDGEESPRKNSLFARLSEQGHAIIKMPFDSGFGAKSNAAIQPAQDRPFLLIGSDDFDFRPPSVRQGIERLVQALEHLPSVAIASGRVNGYRYEGWLEDHGDRIVERYIDANPRHAVDAGGFPAFPCNLTVNYSLIRSCVLGFGDRQLHWDSDVKIGGGEHGAFFVDAMRAGHQVVWVPGVEIREQQGKPTDIRYGTYRGRAHSPGRPCFKRRGIREYVMFGGGVERA